MEQIPVFHMKNNHTMRGVRLEDASKLFPFMSDKENMKFITPHPVQTIAEMEGNLIERLEGFYQQKEIPWVIENDAKEVIGIFRFHKLNFWHKKTEMGAILHPDFQRSGVMTEVFRTVLPYGFEKLGLNRIVGDIFAENEGSRQLLKKFGFREEGVLRATDYDGHNFHDTVVFSMLKQEYDQLKQTFD
ncbi:ribosomal-protein-alanine N-acetyltransferase [Halobacillus dabanensis]|uniref:Ribosomal-protein-alanine N-acetyltransferase n=1 Tax=Halobacillus dabanensis TaxID=240302 RepID=A0A1I4AWJ4_HALDA|nr:GNAT family N-acetyltransferase [Halobacillus dabanensis]SFK60663.1 ribosomal-protein-alanine N-acetyltransferase [Halobacillus dabanensis]